MPRRNWIVLAAAALLAVLLCACREAPALRDENRAVGAILIHSGESLPITEKVYAEFINRQYLFPLDAAFVYYFNAGKEEAYAGDKGFSRLTFAAQIDEDTVGAQGTVCYQYKEGADNALNVYYLYRDEAGVYFQPGSPVEKMALEENKTLSLEEFPCTIELKRMEPTDFFTIAYYDKAGAVLRTQSCRTEETIDGASFDVPNQTAYVEVATYSKGKELLEIQRVTMENSSASICYAADGQILSSKILNFYWQ